MPIDPERLRRELEADADVIRSLHENGDIPEVVRGVDVRFLGDHAAIGRLKAAIAGTEWRIIQQVEAAGGEIALDIQRNQTTDAAALRSLTESALEIELTTGASYDGWGTTAEKQLKNSN